MHKLTEKERLLVDLIGQGMTYWALKSRQLGYTSTIYVD